MICSCTTLCANTALSTHGYQGPRSTPWQNSVFIRDIFPFQVRHRNLDGSFHSVFVAYPSLRNEGNPHLGFSSLQIFQPNAAGKRLFEAQDLKFWAKVEILPLLMEGGSIITTPGHLIVSKRIFDMNKMPREELLKILETEGDPVSIKNMLINAESAGFKQRTEAEIKEELSLAFKVPKERIITLPDMTFETTRHPDNFVSYLKENILVIPKIPAAIIEQLGNRAEKGASNELNLWLETRVAEFKALGFEVLRVPMLSPKYTILNEKSATRATILSTVNWMIAGDKIYVPTFKKYFEKVPKELAEKMHEEIKSELAKYGFKVEFVEAGDLAAGNGLLHSVSAQYDLSEFR